MSVRDTTQKCFTLVEVIAAVAILALLAGVAVMQLSGSTQRVTFDALVQATIDHDRATRRLAERFDRSLKVLADESGVTCDWVWSDRRQLPELTLPRVTAPRNVTFRLRRMNGEPIIGANGRGPDYALGITGPDNEEAWLVVLGTTGQVLRFEHETDVVAWTRRTTEEPRASR